MVFSLSPRPLREPIGSFYGDDQNVPPAIRRTKVILTNPHIKRKKSTSSTKTTYVSDKGMRTWGLFNVIMNAPRLIDFLITFPENPVAESTPLKPEKPIRKR